MKTCSKCGVSKDLPDFYKHETAPDGRRGDCKACVLTARRVRYALDGETLRGRVRSYRLAHPDRVRLSRVALQSKGFTVQNLDLTSPPEMLSTVEALGVLVDIVSQLTARVEALEGR